MQIFKPGRLGNLSGFTLIELVVVLAIISSVSIYGLINIISSREKAAVMAAANQLTNILDTAKDYSLRNDDQQHYGITFSANSPHTITLMCYSCIPPESPVKSITLPKSIQLTNLPSGNKLIFLRQSGRLAGPSITQLKTESTILTLASTKWGLQVVIPVTGSIYTSDIEKI
jgi:prepilin-type N-terminal cleavage/methylation domain-containing protein